MDDNTVDTLGNDPIHKSFDKFYRYLPISIDIPGRTKNQCNEVNQRA